MAQAKFKNFAESTVEMALTVGATTLYINSADEALFPTLSGGDWFFLSIFDGENDPEVVKVTARAAEVLTIVRAQESSNAIAWAAGSYVRLAATAAQMEDALADIQDHESRIDVLESTVLVPISGNFLFCHAFLR